MGPVDSELVSKNRGGTWRESGYMELEDSWTVDVEGKGGMEKERDMGNLKAESTVTEDDERPPPVPDKEEFDGVFLGVVD